MQYLEGWTGANFTEEAYLASIVEQWGEDVFLSTQGRRMLCKFDPLLFALLYFPHHLRSGENHDGPITLADFHLDMCRRTRTWAAPGRHRDAEVAPRDSGKSTWNFLLRPMWAVAYLHRKYVAAFADSGAQAEQHLLSFKGELDNNELLRRDFASLCTPKKRESGVTVSDTKNLYVSRLDQVFQAKGIDSSTLGSKVGAQRPDLILFDDIEPDASNYTEYQKDKRAHSMISSVLPMNLNAAVIVSGTVTMPGSVVHDLVRTVTEPDGDWKENLKGRPDITEEDFSVNYYPALIDENGDAVTSDIRKEEGVYTSVWPEKWSVEYLKSISHTSSFLLNFQNNPRGRDGDWWTNADFHYECLGSMATQWMLQIDPAITTKGSSDYTGLAVVAFQPRNPQTKTLARIEVKWARGVKLVGEKLRALVLKILDWFPLIRKVRVEANQGGETWFTLLHDLPVKLEISNSTVSKEVRLAEGLNLYQTPGHRVVHHDRIPAMEDQAIAYPNVGHDDIIDAVCLAILHYMGTPERKLKARVVGKQGYA